MLNKATLIGHLGKDPEIRTTQSGDKLATFSLATSESWKDKQTGERKSKSEWHSIVVYNTALVSLCENYLKKGSKIYLEGALQTRKWEKDGIERYTTEIVLKAFNGVIVMLDGKGEKQETQAVQESPASGGFDLDDSDIPF